MAVSTLAGEALVMLTRPPPIQTHLMWTTKSGRELAFGCGHLALRGSGQGLAYRRNEGWSRILQHISGCHI